MNSFFNEFKFHAHDVLYFQGQIGKLEEHLSSGSWPQFVLSAIPGLGSFVVDTSVIIEEERQASLLKVNQPTESARCALLDQALHCKKVAWQRHTNLASPTLCLCHLGERFFANLLAMGILSV